MKPAVYVDFCDLGTRRVKTDEFYFYVLAERFDLRITDKPDFLFHAHEGHLHRLHTCKKIYWTAEVYAPDFNQCDYALTTLELDDPRNLRVPVYARWIEPEMLIKNPGYAEAALVGRDRFCCFFTSYRSPKTRLREAFFERLCEYRKVDSCGRALNNTGYQVPFRFAEKIDLMRRYKFYMAFENESMPGYTTEKIVEAMVAGCIPIYYGNPRIVEEFNPDSFLNYHDFPDEETLIERIKAIDQDPVLYRRYLDAPFFHDNVPNRYFSRERILDFFEHVFKDPTPPVASRNKHWMGRWRLLKRNKPHDYDYTPGEFNFPKGMIQEKWLR
jgi:hypothetical protein